MTLTKADLIQEVYQQHDLSKTQATQAVEAFLELAKTTLQEGEGLLLSGFGRFNVKQKNSRRGRNPHTGDDLILAPRRVVTFKPSWVLRHRVNGQE